MKKCENCDRPLATKQDAQAIPPGEGEHLCWGACEPEDWRARALKAERERDEAVTRYGITVARWGATERERDEARKYAEERNDEANKLQRLLNMAAHERDEAQAEVERLREVVRERDEAYDDRKRARAERAEVSRCQRDLRIADKVLMDTRRARDEALAEVLRLRFVDDCRGDGLTYECNLTRPCVACRLRTVAERQREACAERMRLAVDVNAEHLCRATPLVTEGKP